MKAVKEEGKELLAVLLPITTEDVAEAANLGLKGTRSDALNSCLQCPQDKGFEEHMQSIRGTGAGKAFRKCF